MKRALTEIILLPIIFTVMALLAAMMWLGERFRR